MKLKMTAFGKNQRNSTAFRISVFSIAISRSKFSSPINVAGQSGAEFSHMHIAHCPNPFSRFSAFSRASTG